MSKSSRPSGSQSSSFSDEIDDDASAKNVEQDAASKFDANSNDESDVQVYGRLLKYVSIYWAAFLLSMLGFIIHSVANVGFVQLIAYIIDFLEGRTVVPDSFSGSFIREYVGEPETLNRTLIPVFIVLVVFGRGLGTFIGNYFITYIGTNLVHTLRCELFDHLLKLPSRFYDKSAMGHLVAKVTFHVTQVTGAATDAVRVIIREGFTVIGYMAYLFYLNWKLTLIFIVVAPFIGFIVNFAGKRFRKISSRIQDSMGDVTHVASEAVQGYRVVRTFGGTEYERERFNSVSQDNRRQSMKMVITQSIATPVIQLVVSIALACLVWLVLDPSLVDSMDGSGNIIAFITAGGLLAKPIRQLSEVNSTVQKGLAAAEDIFGLFDEASEPDEGIQKLEKVEGKLEFRNVSFSYDAAVTSKQKEEGKETADLVLNDISFTVNPGETIALVGRSGSGKSTLASLIPRFYAPNSGQILLDDIPIDEIQLENLRYHLSLVTQSVTLFNDTVRRNIAYGDQVSESTESVTEASKKAYAWEFISELDNGLDTIVGDDGVLLSGGQRQRLAIARAFLKDSPVLILDEATSALDSESERKIQSALEAVSKGRTTVIIAHRLSTIEKADRILVLDHGKIVGQGTHEELLAHNQYYGSLHNVTAKENPKITTNTTASTLELQPIASSSESGSWFTGDFNPLVKAWYNDSYWVRTLTPLSFVFRLLAGFRRRRIQNSEFRHWLAPVPLIIVGNINVGGTGKSPLVLWIAKLLNAAGYNPGIVGRGYGGSTQSYPLEVTGLTDPALSGDEAVMIARRSGCPMVVDPDRVAATKYLLEEYGCDVVISDDGLQHYALARDIEIAVVDSEKGLGNGLCLPAGPLREPPARLNEVDFMVVNGDKSIELPTKATAVMRLVPTSLINLVTGDEVSVTDHALQRTVHGVAGIGNPDRFFQSLRALGFEVIEHHFDDHHWFKISDLMFGDSLPVIMTEKDAVKCRLLNPELIHEEFWYLLVEAELPENMGKELLEKLTTIQRSEG
ncbi:MAG: subfamily B ATP-binding cassette protein MsbA [Candidatus Azotimanducaceae bacterium]